MFFSPLNKKIWWRLLCGFVLVGIMFVGGLYYVISHANPAKIIALPFIQNELNKQFGAENSSLVTDLPDWLGVNGPRTYLLLFLNNTELRPGGGFIGSYAVVRFENGHPHILKVEGTETIDGAADKKQLVKPPEWLEKYVDVHYWFFRDSNISPDFSVSAAYALDLFQKENGIEAKNIDAVVGVTTHVLEELMRRSGPITVRGITFTPENVIEKLEYEVEYGYSAHGLDFADRKQVLGELFHELVRHLGLDLLHNSQSYGVLFNKLVQEKQIMAYAPRTELQKRFIDYGLSGTFSPTSTDYVWWVDANLAALKTDHSMERRLRYEFAPNPKKPGEFIATTTMTYVNKGKFDWRTTRYRTFARVYVPHGAQLLKVVGALKWDRTTEPGIPTIYQELGGTAFGAFTSVEPGSTRSLSFVYTLPAQTVSAIKQGDYSLYIPKQLGTTRHGLTLSLDFGTNITSALPAEDLVEWGNSRYVLDTDLGVDRYFSILVSH
jgi:hypothetical protein